MPDTTGFRKRVLVIDDHPAILSAVQEVLESIGIGFLGATNGAAGVALAARKHPDLVLCDYFMKEQTGLEVFERMKHHSGTAKIPFVLMSMDTRVERTAREKGVTGFIAKSRGDFFSALLDWLA